MYACCRKVAFRSRNLVVIACTYYINNHENGVWCEYEWIVVDYSTLFTFDLAVDDVEVIG
jgi:hypothetical protein